MTYNDVDHHVMQQLAVIGCNATTSPQLVEIQTPVIRFVVDLFWICCRVHNILTCGCGFDVDLLSMFISQKCNIQHMQDTAVQSKSEWCNKTQ